MLNIDRIIKFKKTAFKFELDFISDQFFIWNQLFYIKCYSPTFLKHTNMHVLELTNLKKKKYFH